MDNETSSSKPIKGEQEKSLQAWTTLTALSVITKKVERLHTTLFQGFRYPAVLAKMCATLEDVSHGRFRFALRAGWFERVPVLERAVA
jgi:alkanesulfonate monooxygenase SsuD/methylene tetrahydromethanopterin reductase-like flavin-dependent oxidoreductase (luciferase family)